MQLEAQKKIPSPPGKTAKAKRDDMLERVRAKEKVEKVKGGRLPPEEGHGPIEPVEGGEAPAKRTKLEGEATQHGRQPFTDAANATGDVDNDVPCGKCQATVPEPVLLCCRCLAVECPRCRDYRFCNRCVSWICRPCISPHGPECRAAIPNKRISCKRPPESQEANEQASGKVMRTQTFDLTVDDSDKDDACRVQPSRDSMEAPPGRVHSIEAPYWAEERAQSRGPSWARAAAAAAAAAAASATTPSEGREAEH